MDELDGPEYIRPAQKECPRCGCCSEDLCAKGRNSIRRCHGHTADQARDVVASCPCSSEWTKHTAAWRNAQVRVTRLARELPVPEESLTLLRALARGAHAEDPNEGFPQLRLRGLAQLVSGLYAITPHGHTYLAALDDVRAPVPVLVLDVDLPTRTARVEVRAWQQGQPVTVLLDHITNDTVMTPEALPGRWLEAEANVEVEHVDRLVLTHYRTVPLAPLRRGWLPAETDTE
ncbi:hypothetical protein [Actinacidiphila sp. ITFR-21]|uniref:hypothetical protein n=1 Tax=Actinacidiphila sp. ITFR-21 TaxID=3075199 RepID=UPI00288A55FD|nr:hypothetical protein [Streptomyces sp. ITFR-21]WNI20321.1 hypothetical protein RLT57_33170 [Streptomyces sp. ITFR-21]